jgi:TorA maturation chaperone TorD
MSLINLQNIATVKAAIEAHVGPWAAKQAAWIAVHPTTTLWYGVAGVLAGAFFGKHFGGILPF